MWRKAVDFWYGTMESQYLSRMGHFTTGFMISAIVGHYYGYDRGLIAGIIAAVVKELVDKLTGRGNPEIVAAVVTTAGTLLAYLILK